MKIAHITANVAVLNSARLFGIQLDKLHAAANYSDLCQQITRYLDSAKPANTAPIEEFTTPLSIFAIERDVLAETFRLKVDGEVVLDAHMVDADFAPAIDNDACMARCLGSWDSVDFELHSRDSEPDCKRWSVDDAEGKSYDSMHLSPDAAVRETLSRLVSAKPVALFQ